MRKAKFLNILKDFSWNKENFNVNALQMPNNIVPTVSAKDGLVTFKQSKHFDSIFYPSSCKVTKSKKKQNTF